MFRKIRRGIANDWKQTEKRELGDEEAQTREWEIYDVELEKRRWWADWIMEALPEGIWEKEEMDFEKRRIIYTQGNGLAWTFIKKLKETSDHFQSVGAVLKNRSIVHEIQKSNKTRIFISHYHKMFMCTRGQMTEVVSDRGTLEAARFGTRKKCCGDGSDGLLCVGMDRNTVMRDLIILISKKRNVRRRQKHSVITFEFQRIHREKCFCFHIALFTLLLQNYILTHSTCFILILKKRPAVTKTYYDHHQTLRSK